MSEESITNQVKSEKTEPKDGDEKANPVERLVIAKGGPKILSRYLSGPTRSCHDVCKYGVKHAVEAKPWSKAQRRVTTRGRKTEVPEETATSLAGKEKSSSNSKPSLTSKIGMPNCQVDNKQVTLSLTNEKTITPEKNVPPFQETNVSMEHANSDPRQARLKPSSLPVQKCSNGEAKRETVKTQSPFGSSSRKKTESRSKETRASLIGGKKKSMPPSIPLSSKHNVKKPSSLSAKTAKNLTAVAYLENHKNVEEVKPELANNDNFPERSLDIIEPTSANLSVEATLACDATNLSSASSTSSGEKSLKQTSKKTSKSGSSASSRKGPRHAGHGIRPVTHSHPSSGSRGKRHVQHTRHSASPSPSASTISSSNSSLGKQNGGTSKFNKTGRCHQGENVKVGKKARPKRSTVVGHGAANKVIPARKLTFKRGKVIDVQPQSNVIPRRLKFRPARRLGEDFQRDISNTRKRVSTRKEVDGIESNDANLKSGKVVPALQTGSKPRSEQVVLRHQNVEGKKVNPRLYNNVIEETASMLAELRKSKVKALVGAFETVISLDSPREATPSEISTAC